MNRWGRYGRGDRQRLVIGGITVLVVVVAGVLIALFHAPVGASQDAQQQSTPKPPTDLTAAGTSTGGTVLLSWQPPRPVPVGYHIYRAAGLHSAYALVGTVDAPNVDTFTDDTDLVIGNTYAYTVTAFTRQAESAPVGPIVVVLTAPQTAVPTSPPPPPPTPLPTFAPLSQAKMTAIARIPTPVGTPLPTVIGSPGPAAVVPAAGSATPVPTANSVTAVPTANAATVVPTASNTPPPTATVQPSATTRPTKTR